MTCSRDKNPMTEEVVNAGLPLHVGLWGGSSKSDFKS